MTGRRPFFFQAFSVLCLVWALFLTCIHPVGAQGSMGSADLRLLVLLHPAMAGFDFSHNRFYRAAPGNNPNRNIGQEITQGWAKAEPILRDLKTQRERILRQRMDSMLERENSLQELTGGSPARIAGPLGATTAEPIHVNVRAISGGSLDSRAKAVADAEARFTKAMAENDRQIAEIDAKIADAQETAYAPVFLTRVETDRKFEEIIREILGYVNQAAQEQRLAVVVDASYGRSGRKLAPDMICVPDFPKPGDTMGSRLFHLFSTWETVTENPSAPVPGPDGKTVSKASHVAVAMGDQQVRSLQRYLEFRPYLGEGAAGFSSGNFFLAGGVDLTPIVAAKLFVQYRVPTEIQNSFFLLIRDYTQFERGGTEKFGR